MQTIELRKIDFSCEDMLRDVKAKRRREPTAAMLRAARAAYGEGLSLIELRAALEFYPKVDVDGEHLVIAVGDTEEKIYIGPRAGILTPAQEIVIAISTAGKAIADAIHRYSDSGDGMTAYYLDLFGVTALSELSDAVRKQVGDYAHSKSWGAGPSMQPGSVKGWEVRGQRDLYRLGRGDMLGLSINGASMLVPHISSSMLIGIGAHYAGHNVGSLCHECDRYDSCLWRRENVKQETI
ncbi:MAG: hypothetical protein Q4D58_03870 [Synergistaceae bacterium]|nr:hypothetical protein [Synergistaceae bacterium]